MEKYYLVTVSYIDGVRYRNALVKGSVLQYLADLQAKAAYAPAITLVNALEISELEYETFKNIIV